MNHHIRRSFMRGLIIGSVYSALFGRKIISMDFIHCNNNPCFPDETDSLPRNPAKIHRQSDCKPSQAGGGEKLRRSLIKFAEELSLFQNETTYGFPQINFLAHDVIWYVKYQ